MTLELDIYEQAKRIRLDELDARINHLKLDFDFWEKQYLNSGDKFSQGMYNVTLGLWMDTKRVRDYINSPSVICQPLLSYQFPQSEL